MGIITSEKEGLKFTGEVMKEKAVLGVSYHDRYRNKEIRDKTRVIDIAWLDAYLSYSFSYDHWTLGTQGNEIVTTG